MSRPNKFEDLDPRLQKGLEVATINHDNIMSLPRKELICFLQMLETLDQSIADGVLDTEDFFGNDQIVTYRIRPTEEQRAKKLHDAQFSWDRNKRHYETALTDPDSVPRYMRWSVDNWAENENKPAIHWPDTDEVAED